MLPNSTLSIILVLFSLSGMTQVQLRQVNELVIMEYNRKFHMTKYHEYGTITVFNENNGDPYDLFFNSVNEKVYAAEGSASGFVDWRTIRMVFDVDTSYFDSIVISSFIPSDRVLSDSFMVEKYNITRVGFTYSPMLWKKGDLYFYTLCMQILTAYKYVKVEGYNYYKLDRRRAYPHVDSLPENFFEIN